METGEDAPSAELAEKQEGPSEVSPIRNARREDARAVSEILAEAFPALYRGTFGLAEPREVAGLLSRLYEAGQLSLEDTRLYERDGRVVGVMILHTGHLIGRGTPSAYWRSLRRRYGLLRTVRAFFGGISANLMLEKRIPRAYDLVYIEALAVAESCRGQGIGSALLREAERWAKERGRSRLALHVLLNNTGARKLYERFGFVPWSSHPAARSGSLTSHGNWSAILMSRAL